MKITLVLLPGLNGTAGLFKPLQQCAEHQFDVLCISYPTDKKMAYPELTELVLNKLQSIDGNFILLGESFSGPVALFIAEKKPVGLIGVILAATFITAPNLALGRFLPWTTGFALAKPLYGIRKVLSQKKNQSLIAAISTELQKVSPAVLSFRVAQTYAVNATEALFNCDVPIIYFRGIYDYVVAKKNLKEILSVKASVNVIEFRTQHFLLQSKPEQAFDEIRKFAAQLQ